MKKLISVFIALVLTLSLTALTAMADQSVQYGVLSYLNMTESEYDAQFLSPEAKKLKSEIENWLFQNRYFLAVTDISDLALDPFRTVFYDSIDAMLMALNAGEITGITDLPQTTAQYLCAHNDQLASHTLYNREKIEWNEGFAMECFKMAGTGFSVMTLEENQALCDAINSAIAGMKADGTLDQLIQAHIYDAIAQENIEPIVLDSVEGRETITVALTGSLPPMDYVAADGTFAGFNTAMLAELGRRLDKNIQLVQVDSIGRAAALASGTVDAVFWARSNPYGVSYLEKFKGMTRDEYKASLAESNPDYNEQQTEIMLLLYDAGMDYQDMDIPEHTVITEPFFFDALVTVFPKQAVSQ